MRKNNRGKNPTILSLDVGKIMGVAVVSKKLGLEHIEEKKVLNNLHTLYKYVNRMVLRWKPKLIIIPIPTAHRTVIINHSEKNGVIVSVAQKHKIPVHRIIDSHCKKTILGKGDVGKLDIREHYKELVDRYGAGEHELDAVMFIDTYNATHS